MIYFFEAGKDVAFSESAKEILYHTAYNLPNYSSCVDCKGKGFGFVDAPS